MLLFPLFMITQSLIKRLIPFTTIYIEKFLLKPRKFAHKLLSMHRFGSDDNISCKIVFSVSFFHFIRSSSHYRLVFHFLEFWSQCVQWWRERLELLIIIEIIRRNVLLIKENCCGMEWRFSKNKIWTIAFDFFLLLRIRLTFTIFCKTKFVI